MNARKGLIFSTCTVLIMFFILKQTTLSHFFAFIGQHLGDDPIQNARIERDEEEIAYQNAIRWAPLQECF